MKLLRLVGRRAPAPQVELVTVGDQAVVSIVRGRHVAELARIGPNEVHAVITHADGSITDLGVSHNLLTTAGRDLIAAAMGQSPGQDGAATSTSATSLTKTAAGWTTDQWKGWRVWCPVTGLTTSPVYGNIGTNSATVLTIDQWWTAADGTGTTPAGTNAYQILPAALPRFMGVTTDAAAAAAGDTVLASEITTGGLNRALATYAHTAATATFTLQKAYTASSGFTAIHKMGLFTAANTTAGGVMVFESVLNADATVVSGDTLTVTDTVTLS